MRASADGGGCFPTGRHYPGIAHLLRVQAAGLAEEFDGQTAYADLPLVGIDTETTGRDAGVDRIVELAAVTWRGGEVVDRTAWLVDPGCPIPKEATDVHGIENDDVRGRPSFADVLPEMIDTFDRALPLAYNAEFDKRFLQEELVRAGAAQRRGPPAVRLGVEWVDPFVWAVELLESRQKKTLTAVCEVLGIEVSGAHRAAADAEAALKVMSALCKDARVPKTYAALIREQRRLSRAHAAERAAWKGARTRP